MDIYKNHMLRRWSMNVATGEIGCFHDAVDLRSAIPQLDIDAIHVHNQLMQSTANALMDYSDALRVTEPEEPHTQTVYDDEGEPIDEVNTVEYQRWLDAQSLIAATPADVIALHTWRSGEPERYDENEEETVEWQAWDAARSTAIAAFGDSVTLSVDPATMHADRVRRDAINVERERRIKLGGTFTVTGIGDIPVTGNDEDIRNLQGLGMAALARLAAGDSTTVTVFRDAVDVTHSLVPAQVLQLWQLSAAYVSAIYQASWALKENSLDYLDGDNWP